MLVLSCKKNERFLIADNIFVEVLQIRGDKVRLGIIAPKDVPIVREELLDTPHDRPDHVDREHYLDGVGDA